MEPKIAANKPDTWKLATKLAVINNISPLITNKNNPKLKIVKGKVNNVNTGLIKVFTRPRIKAAQKPAPKPPMLIPGTIFAVNTKANIVINNLTIAFKIITPLFSDEV